MILTPIAHRYRWLGVPILGLFVAIALVGWWNGPPPTTDRPPTQTATQAHSGPDRPELALFRHYLQDLRWMLTGDTYPVCRGKLAKDIGCVTIQDVQRALFIDKEITKAIDIFARTLHLTEAEYDAWLLMLMILREDEARPSWQKAGVRR